MKWGALAAALILTLAQLSPGIPYISSANSRAPLRHAGQIASTVPADRATGVRLTKTAIFIPSRNLQPNTSHDASMQALDLNGKPVGAHWKFTTGGAGAIKVLHSFSGSDGAKPWGSLTLVSLDGRPTLFGRTNFGGARWRSDDSRNHPGGGVIFRLPLDSKRPGPPPLPFSDSSRLPRSGYQPHHDSMLLIGNKLYCATLNSGQFSLKDYVGNGAIFTVDPATMDYRAIHNFSGPATGGPGAGGTNPHSCFSLSTDATTLYGATARGGEAGVGTLYALPVAGGEPKYIYSFQRKTGDNPHGRPVAVNFGGHDILLGMTRTGGAKGNGVIFVFDTTPGLKPSQAYTDVHDFAGSPNDGAIPDHGNLVVLSASPRMTAAPPTATAYSMTTEGGSAGGGILFRAVFRFASPPTVKVTVMHNFGAGPVTDLVSHSQVPDGSLPRGSLLLHHGWLYGLTSHGGINGGGVVFRTSVDPSCTGQSCYGVLGAFDTRTRDAPCNLSAPTPQTCDLTGSAPIDNLIVGPDGITLYGMTSIGGAFDPANRQRYTTFGTVFSIRSVP